MTFFSSLRAASRAELGSPRSSGSLASKTCGSSETIVRTCAATRARSPNGNKRAKAETRTERKVVSLLRSGAC